MLKKIKYVFFVFIIILTILVLFSVVLSYSQSGPTTICNTGDLENMSVDHMDSPLSTFTTDTCRYWYLSENWGNTFQKFAGPLDDPAKTLIWEKTRAQLFTNGSIDGQPWIVNLYKDTNGLLAFVHIERAGDNEQKGRIGLAWSTDNGNTFTYLGHILSPYGDHDMTSGGFMQGVPYLIKDGYFYIYYTDNNGYYGYEDSIAVARASVSDVIDAAEDGNTSLWYKYYNGSWNEAGLGGNFTRIANARGISHTGAAYSTYNNKCYLVTTYMAWQGSQTTTYVKLWESSDGVNWTLYKTVADDSGENVGANTGYQYANIVNGDGTSNGIIGQTFYIYCGFDPYGENKIIRRWAINLAGGAPSPSPTPTPTAPNLAYNLSYSCSSYYNENQTPDKAFDGYLNTNWQAAQYSTYNGQWIAVDFGTNITFNRAVITEYGNRTTGYRIEYWNGSSWLTAYTGTTIGDWTSPKTVTFPAVNGSKVRIYFTTGTEFWPIIYEFEVNYVSSTENLALDMSYSSSSDWDEVQTAENAFDDYLPTYWRAEQNSYNGEWLQVNFGENKTFNKAVLNEYGGRTTGYRIEYWNGSNWLTAYTGTTIGQRTDFKIITFTPVTGNKARIYFTSGTGEPIIYEFEIYNESPSSNFANLRTYGCSSYYDENQTADKGFDGTKNTNWQAEQYSNYNGQWLEVNFGSNRTFNKAVITEYGNRTTGYRIEYWNGSSWLTAYTGTTIGDWYTPKTVTFSAVTGSKARIYFTSGTGFWPIIYEFEIYNE
jgi:hypothetical protein